MKRLQLMVNAVSSFSSQPLIWLFNAGILITLLSFAYVAYLIDPQAALRRRAAWLHLHDGDAWR